MDSGEPGRLCLLQRDGQCPLANQVGSGQRQQNREPDQDGLGLPGRVCIVSQSIEDKRVRRIFHRNRYDPAYAGSVVLGWCRKKLGKQNAVWLFGPAPTGKANIAVATAHAVPFYGRVNWTSENFLFMIVWTRR